MLRTLTIRATIFSALVFLMTEMPVQAGDLKITEMAVTTKIVRGNPIDSVHRISSRSVKTLFCFTRIANPTVSDSVIKHVWYKDDQPVGEQELPVKGEKWRTWSKRPIDDATRGEWRVDALDGGGNVLKTVRFKIH